MSDYIGQLMLDIQGLDLSTEDADLLAHPQVGGLILFSRNFRSIDQLGALIAQVRALKPQCLIAVDHEGGRVQRFRSPFTHIPAMARLGEQYRQAPEQALVTARQWGWLMASELRVLDVDFSFAPVLDRDCGVSDVIGDRAFAAATDAIVALAGAFVSGMHRAGMAATGKHFPGHGAVREDSHHELPVDPRTAAEIRTGDMGVFAQLIAQGLDAIMPAHVVYPAIDTQPAGFSSVWLQQILRQELGFDGCIFSDDLSMAGAAGVGSFAERAQAALAAGCDMILVCNHRPGALEVLDYLSQHGRTEALRVQDRLQAMRGRSRPRLALDAFQRSAEAADIIAGIGTHLTARS
jgi:beta-N-acetylhexosaminidase